MAIIHYKPIEVRIIEAGPGTQVKLQAGLNEIDDSDWAKARVHVLDIIGENSDKQIEEIAVKSSEIKDENGNVTGFNVESKTINQIDTGVSMKLIKKTFNIKLLEKWIDEARKPELVSAIQRQLGEIEKYGSDKKSKSDED